MPVSPLDADASVWGPDGPALPPVLSALTILTWASPDGVPSPAWQPAAPMSTAVAVTARIV
jgi:hypothetical protein